MSSIARSDAPARRTVELGHLLVLALLWGASYGLIKLAVAGVPPVTLVAARVVIAGALLWAIMVRQGIVLPRSRAMWGKFLVQAAMNSILPFTLIAWGEQTVDSGLAAILNSTTPIFVFLITLGRQRDRAGWLRPVGIALGLAGTIEIIGWSALARVGAHAAAELAIVAATLCYAVAAVFGRSFADVPPIVPAAGSMLCAAAVMVPASLLIDRPWTLAPSMTSLAALAALATLSTAGALVVYFRLLSRLGSVGTASVAYLRAGVSVLLGILLLGEQPTVATGIGLALVLVGVVAITAPARPR